MHDKVIKVFNNGDMGRNFTVANPMSVAVELGLPFGRNGNSYMFRESMIME
jgi:hypothetical protein